jgi:hypothetical protein
LEPGYNASAPLSPPAGTGRHDRFFVILSVVEGL